LANNITYGSLTFLDVPSDPTSGSYVLTWQTFREQAVPRKEATFRHFGLDGMYVVDGGAGQRNWRQTGMMIADGNTGFVAGWNALRAIQNNTTDTLTANGEALAGVDCPGGVRQMSRMAGKFQILEYEIIWRQP
jgi:hypothetical protein